jgi:hypothetical protein
LIVCIFRPLFLSVFFLFIFIWRFQSPCLFKYHSFPLVPFLFFPVSFLFCVFPSILLFYSSLLSFPSCHMFPVFILISFISSLFPFVSLLTHPA